MPTPVFFPGKSHVQRSCRPWGRKRVGHDLVIKQQQQLIKQLIILKNAIFLGHTDIHLIALLVTAILFG